MNNLKIVGNRRWIEIEPRMIGKQLTYGFYYKGQFHLLDDFMRANGNGSPFQEYDGYCSDSAFSGTLIKLNSEGDAVQVFSYYS